MKEAALCVVAMMLIGVSAHGQGMQIVPKGKARKADTSLIRNLNAIENGVNKAMDREGSGLNFFRWDAPIALIDAAKQEYQAQKDDVNTLHDVIASIKSNGSAYSAELFATYITLQNIRDILGDFEKHADESQRDVSLAADLTSLNTALGPEEVKLSDSVLASIVTDSSELAACK